MKAKLIIINLILSFTGICVESPFWASMVGAGWLIASFALFNWADRKGLLNEISKRFKLDGL